MAAPSTNTAPYLKIEDETRTHRRDWFIVFIIGATLTKTF